MLKFLKVFFTVILMALALLSVAGLVFYQTKGMRFYSVQTDSMAPVIARGDLSISDKINPVDLRVGDIIAYKSLQPDHIVVNHRVYKLFPKQGYLVTKGDNLSQPDPPIPFSNVIGETKKVMPKIGYAADFLREPLGLILAIYLPLLAIVAYEYHRLANHFSYHSYANVNI